MTTTATNLSIISATVHPAGNGTEQITLVLRGALDTTVTPAGRGTTMQPKSDVTSQYVPTGYVGNTVVLTTDDVADTFVSLVG